MEKLVLENEYEITEPLFGAAFAAPNKGTTILCWFRPLSTVLCSTENRRIQVLFKPVRTLVQNNPFLCTSLLPNFYHVKFPPSSC